MIVWTLLPLVWASLALSSEPEAGESDSAVPAALHDPQIAAELEITTRHDEAIERVLSARYARIPALAAVRPEIAAGVVTLRGTVTDETRRQIAAQLAQSLDGVIAIDNRLQIETALDRRLAPVLEDGIERGRRLITALPLLAVSLLIVWVFHRMGRWLASRPRLFSRIGKNPFLADLLRQILGLAMTITGILIALDLLGATALVGAVLGAAGIAGLALGFAFKDLVENHIAGILLSLRQPFAPKDHVVIDGHEGRVAALTSRATILITMDGNHLRLPNSLVFKGVILNYSRNPVRRFQFDLAIGSKESALAQNTALRALSETDGVIAQPPPVVLLRAPNESMLALRCMAWVDQRTASLGQVQSEALRRVRNRLEEAGLKAPESTYRVQLLQADDDLPAPPPNTDLPSTTTATDIDHAIVDDQLDVERQVEAQVEAEALAQADKNLLNPDAARE